MEPLDPARAFPSDEEIASFFDNEETKRIREDKRLEIQVSKEMGKKIQQVGYTFPDPGTERYENIRESFRAVTDIELNPKKYSDLFKRSELLEFALTEKANQIAAGEEVILKLIANILKEYIALTEKEVKLIADLEMIQAKVRTLIADALIIYGLPSSNPVFTVLDQLIPGIPVDFDDENMLTYYSGSLETLANAELHKRRTDEFEIGIREITDALPMVADEDLDRILSLKNEIVNETVFILSDESLTVADRAQKLDDVAVRSPLGYEDALKIINYTKEHKSLLE